MDKQAKAKEKAKKPPPGKAKTVKGKPSVNEDKFRGDGMNFKGKLVGLAEVNGPRGDNMCIEAIRKLKLHAVKMNKEIGEHKQKIVMNINLKGIKLIDEKTQLVVHEHMINKVSYITHDPEDKRTFGYIVSVPSCSTGHQLFALKTEKGASTVTTTLYELFQVVYKLRQEAQRMKATMPTALAKTSAANNVSNGPAHDPVADHGIYEEPAKCTPPLSKKPATPHYKDSTSVSSTDRIQYEVPAFDAEPIFGDSFIAEAGRKDSTLSETGSVSSANVFRSDSISSSSSDALAQSGEHARTAAVVLSPAGDTFASSHEGIPTAGAKQSFSFDAAFPPISSPSNNTDTTSRSFPESQSFQTAFPTDSSFGSKADTTGASFTENQSFQAAFPDDSNFGGKVDKTTASLTENESFQAAFPDDASFGSKADTTGASFTENQSFQAAFPDDSNFGGKVDKTAASLTENESFQAAFPDDSSFDSKADTTGATFTENQSFQAAFPADTSFGSRAEAAAVSISESQPFEASFSPVTSSDTESSTPGGNLNPNQTFGVVFPSDNGPSTTVNAVSGNTKENQSIEAGFPKISGPGVDVKKPDEPAFEAAFPDASSTSTDTNKGGSFSKSGTFETAFPVIPGSSSGAAHGGLTIQNQGFDDAFSSVAEDSSPTNQTAFQSQAFEAEFPPVSTALPKTNESSSQSDQSEGFEAAFSPTSSTSMEVEVGSENQATDAVLSANVGFQADFPPLSSTAEASNPSATTFETNFDDVFAPVTPEGGVKIFTEPGLKTSGKEDNNSNSEAFGVDSAFENLKQPALKSGGKPEDLFASKDDPFFAFGEDSNKKAPPGYDDPFAPSPATKGKPSGVSQFESAFGADSFLASPFEFKESSQSKTANYVAKPDDSSTTVNSGNSAGAFAWNDAFGESSKTTGEAEGENVSAIDTSLVPTTESRPSTNLNLTKPTEVVPSVAQSAEISPTDSGSAVIDNNYDSNYKSDTSSTKQDPFVEFKVDFDAFKPATANTPKSSSGEWSDPKSEETDEEQSQILKAVPLPTMSVTPVDVELSQVIGEVPEVDASKEERPTDLNFSTEKPTNKRERPLSPSAPPPLPPRPVVSPPSLPPRPQTSPSMSTGVPASVGETPPLPPLPNINQTRKLPPALPPRVDLQSKPEEKIAEVVDSFTGFDPFRVQSMGTTSDNDSAWVSAWPAPDVKDSSQENKENGFLKAEGGKSDPFGDDFFATFDFDNKSAAEDISTPAEGASALLDPFTSMDSTDPFGSEDLFSQSPFASSKATRSSSIKNMFGSSLSDSFSIVPGNDPFSDTSDPFAGKGELSSDPFTISPEKKDIKLEEDPFTDSFA